MRINPQNGSAAVVVLAGGEGQRIGGGKPLISLAGERLVDRSLRMAHSWSECIAVSVRYPIQVEPVDAWIILDDRKVAGPLGGLVSALEFGAKAGREFVLTIPSDMPFLPPDLFDQLLLNIGNLGCAIAKSGGHIHPVCGLWRTTTLDHFASYVAGQRRSLKGFAALVGYKEVEWMFERVDPFFNINTVDDLAEAEKRLADQKSRTSTSAPTARSADSARCLTSKVASAKTF